MLAELNVMQALVNRLYNIQTERQLIKVIHLPPQDVQYVPHHAGCMY